MHNNFYFLRQLTRTLTPILTGSVISECFTQSKDELILRFEIGRKSFFIRASLAPEISCLSFPENFQRARKNSVDLFPQLVGRRVTGMRQFNHERSFALRLSENLDLLFKMHGNRTNLILFHRGKATELFRKNMKADLTLSLDELDRTIEWTEDYFQLHRHNLKAAYFPLGKIVWRYLAERNFFEQPPGVQWTMLRVVMEQLEHPSYYITSLDGKPALSLLETGSVSRVLNDPLAAANEYYFTFTQQYALAKEKAQLLTLLRSRIDAGQNYCLKNEARLASVENDDHYRLWADLVMANLHALPENAEKVVLPNFYDPDNPVEVPLKKDQTPQRNAEIFYRKAKNRHIEIERLQSAVRQKREELVQLSARVKAVEAASDLRSLRALRASMGPVEDERTASANLPYHEFHFQGFRIWVGKGAQANDVLTFRFGFKEDLWLHAKDVAGAHVLIKYQAGRNFPKEVIEYAASLAAYNSKRKTESLCPVTVTPKKFVRKRKGDPPGLVIVEREKVILVAPATLR